MQISAEGSGVGQYPHFPVSSGGTRRIDGGEDIHKANKDSPDGEMLVEVLELTAGCGASLERMYWRSACRPA